MRLIDADAKELRQRININFGSVTRFIVKSILKDAPTIAADPVVHGRWIDAREYCSDFMCSNCDALYGTNKFNYCPNCGSKMDGGA